MKSIILLSGTPDHLQVLNNLICIRTLRKPMHRVDKYVV